jgi:hypothetical protein
VLCRNIHLGDNRQHAGGVGHPEGIGFGLARLGDAGNIAA